MWAEPESENFKFLLKMKYMCTEPGELVPELELIRWSGEVVL